MYNPQTPQRPDTGGPQPPKPGSSNRAAKVIIGVIVGVAVLTWLNGNSGSGSGGSGSHAVTYRVTGGHGASITYENSSSDTAQATDAATPWTDVETLSDGDFYYVSAQNQGGGTITCSVSVDGVQVDTNSSSGEYAICTASGSV